MLFWLIAARYATTEDIGIATALFSAVTLITTISNLGLTESMTRFFPTGNKGRILSTLLVVNTAVVLFVGIIFLLGIRIWSPELTIALEEPFIFLGILVGTMVVTILGGAFVALREGRIYFIQTVILGSKVLFLLPLVAFGALGIFSTGGLASILIILMTMPILAKYGLRLKRPDLSFLKQSFSFSAASYITGILTSATSIILPIIILNIIGASETAYFYIAYSVASLLFMIPQAIATSLFVEGSHGTSIEVIMKKSLYISFILLIPSILVIFLAGDYILSFFGHSYSTNGFELLKVLALSSIFFTVFHLLMSVKKVLKDIKGLIIFSSLIFILTLGLSILFSVYFGLIGTGYAWVIGYGLATVLIWFSSKRDLGKIKDSNME